MIQVRRMLRESPMLKSGKPQLHHLAIMDQSVMVAKAASDAEPSRITDFKVFDLADQSFESALGSYMGCRKGHYARAYCSFLPSSRFLRRATLDSAAKVKDSAALMEVLHNVCKVSSQENEVGVLLASGAQLDVVRPTNKEILFAGVRSEEISETQDRLLEWGVYPLRLEMATLPVLASVRKIAKEEGRKGPTLVIEVGDAQSFLYIVSENGFDISKNISFGINTMLPEVKSELGLADEAVAKRILQANTFDFTEMAPALLRRLVKELQAFAGFYEVQTGYTIGQIYMSNLSSRFHWVGSHLSRAMGLDLMCVAFERWAPAVGVEIPEELDLSNADPLLWNLFALAGKYE